MTDREIARYDRVRLNEHYGSREIVVDEVHKNSIVSVDREWIGKGSVESILLPLSTGRDKDLRWALAIERFEEQGLTDDAFYALPYHAKQDLLDLAQTRVSMLSDAERVAVQARWDARS